MESRSVLKTPLHDVHVAAGARMVHFAGYEMPIHYPAGIRAEHAATRAECGVFDVSHMGEFTVRGPEAEALVQYLTVNDVARTTPGQAQYSALCNEGGFVLDDLLIYRFADRFMLVVNAANRAKDWRWIAEHAQGCDVELSDDSDEIALVAVQGPKCRGVLAPLAECDLDDIGYYRFAEAAVAGVDAIVSRTGYTGEDGFELYVPADGAEQVWRAVAETGGARVQPAGLGARDSLRLEMGYALYGADLDERHTALESALGWVVKLDAGDFVGRAALAAQKEHGVARRLTGIRLDDRGFPRSGYPVVHLGGHPGAAGPDVASSIPAPAGEDGEDMGVVTSGVFSPSLGAGVALARLPAGAAKPGLRVGIRVRDRVLAGRTQRPPFYTEGSILR